MKVRYFIYFTMLVTLFGCQPLTKPRDVLHGAPRPEQSILRNVDIINRGIVDRMPQVPHPLPTPIP